MVAFPLRYFSEIAYMRQICEQLVKSRIGENPGPPVWFETDKQVNAPPIRWSTDAIGMLIVLAMKIIDEMKQPTVWE